MPPQDRPSVPEGVRWDVEHQADGTHAKVSGPGNVLMGGFSTFVQQPRCRLYVPLTTIADATGTGLTLSTPMVPDGPIASGYLIGLRQIATNRQVQILYDGLYWIQLMVSWDDAAAGQRTIVIARNGTTGIATNTIPGAAGITLIHEVTCLVPAAAGDFFDGQVFQNSGGGLDIAPAGTELTTYFSMAKVA